MDPQLAELSGGAFGALLGTVGGILGAAIGIYCSIKNTAGPRERAFVIRASAIGCLALITFLIALGLTPWPYRQLLWVPYMPLLLLAVRWGNRRQMQIRSEESRDAEAGAALDRQRQ